MKKSKFGNPTLTIKVENARAAELERIRLAIENGIENLGGTLESVVDFAFDKIDALAEVRRFID